MTIANGILDASAIGSLGSANAYDTFDAGCISIVSTYNYYVDSRRGDDTADGLSAATAKRTIAAIQALAGAVNGARIGLARGSVWREQLSLTGNDQNVGSYGLVSDPRPSLRGDDPIPAGTITLSSGKTYTYQVPVFLPNLLGKQWVNVWENGSYMTFVADTATVESTPGTYTVSTQTNASGSVSGSTQTLYFHPSANDDPRVSGKLYEYSRREAGITSSGQRTTVHGIETKRNGGHNGSLVLYGFGNVVWDCACLEGSKHNAFVSGGLVDSSIFQEQYYGTSSADLLVVYGTAVNGQTATIQNSTFKRTTFNTAGNVNGIYSHTSDGSNFDTVTMTRNAFTNVANGFNGTTGGPANVNFTGNVMNGLVYGMAYAPSGALVVKGNRFTSSATNPALVNLQTAFTSADISNNQAWIYDPFSIISIAPPSGTPTILIRNNILYVGNPSASAPSTPVYVTRGNLTMTGNVFDSAGNWAGRTLDITVTSFTADNNVYAGAQGGQYVVTINGVLLGGTTLSGWTAYKTAANAANLELNSTTATSGSYAGSVQ